MLRVKGGLVSVKFRFGAFPVPCLSSERVVNGVRGIFTWLGVVYTITIIDKRAREVGYVICRGWESG